MSKKLNTMNLELLYHTEYHKLQTLIKTGDPNNFKLAETLGKSFGISLELLLAPWKLVLADIDYVDFIGDSLDFEEKLLKYLKEGIPNYYLKPQQEEFQFIAHCFLKNAAFFGVEGAGGKLTKIPKSIQWLSSLKRLAIEGIGLQTIDIELPNQLTYLSLDNNDLVELPSAVSQLQELTYLNISNNPITELPTTLTTIKNLKSLLVFNTKISKETIETFAAKIPHCEIYHDIQIYNFQIDPALLLEED